MKYTFDFVPALKEEPPSWISMGPNGIRLNNKSLAAMGNPKFIMIGYDAKANKVGVKAVNESVPGAIQLKPSKYGFSTGRAKQVYIKYPELGKLAKVETEMVEGILVTK